MAKVLVVDDDPAVRQMLSDFLSAQGHEATLASDGAQGLTALAAGRFDLVITDLVMPGKEGVETIKEIRRRQPGLKIMAISGGGLDSGLTYLRIARIMGANTTLAKPFTFTAFKKAVEETLGAPAA